MKKLTSIFLVLILILGLNTTAFAADSTNVTVSDSSLDEREFNGYQILKLTTSLKPSEDHPDSCDGTNHLDGCYNYAYAVNEKYIEILQAETLANGRNELWGATGKPTGASAVTETQILEYLSYQTSDSGDTFGTLRQVADRLYLAIAKKGLDADMTGLTATGKVIEQGYWMFVDVTNVDAQYEANSLIVMDTKGQEEITITPKTALPTVEKKVKDIDDSEDSNILDNAWHDSADHDIDNTAIPFKLTATLPANVQYYKEYGMTFHDTLSAGLTLDKDSFVVLMYDTKHKADEDTDLNDGTTVDPKHYNVVTTGLEDGCTFEVEIENAFLDGVTKDTAFVVYYEAHLNENAVIGAAGNPNVVYLQYSNNPYGEGTGKTQTDKVTVFTYQVVVNKVDSENAPLKGAGFTLFKKVLNAGTGLTEEHQIGTELVGGDMTTFTWKGLDDGDYILKETTVPDGYNKMSDLTFSVSAVHSETSGTPELISLDGGVMGTGEVTTGKIEKDIVNHTGTVLPETGGAGTMMLLCGGSLLVILAAVFMITRKKMSIYED